MDTEEKDYEAFKTYVQLWSRENPIKTNKLQVLLVVNGLLVSALQVGEGRIRNQELATVLGRRGVFFDLGHVDRTDKSFPEELADKSKSDRCEGTV